MKGLLVPSVLTTFLVAGCGDATPYQAVSSERGTLLVNRYTGTTYRVLGEQVLELSRRSLAEQKTSSEPKTYNLGTVPNTPLTFHIRLRYLDNKMFYIAEVKPGAAKVAEKSGKDWSESFEVWRRMPGSSFTARLHDDVGFVISNVVVPLDEMTRTVNDKDIPIQYTKSGDIQVAAQTFDAIRNASLGWRGIGK